MPWWISAWHDFKIWDIFRISNIRTRKPLGEACYVYCMAVVAAVVVVVFFIGGSDFT